MIDFGDSCRPKQEQRLAGKGGGGWVMGRRKPVQLQRRPNMQNT